MMLVGIGKSVNGQYPEKTDGKSPVFSELAVIG